MRRIEVVHLDKWVADLLQRHGYRYRLLYWPNPILEEIWDAALAHRPDGFPAGFFREEWEHVIQPAGCTTAEEYRRVARTGRGVRLSRAQRKAIWPVFEQYRNRLEAKGLRESVDAMRDAAGILEGEGSPSPYCAVVVDEAQDMSSVAFRLLRRIVPQERNDLFIVGDGHQRIYRKKVVLGQAGVNIVGRSRKLYVNYRTTDEIRKYAVALLQDVAVDDLDGGADDNSKFTSLVHGEAPEVVACANFEDEVAAIARFLEAGEANRTCLVTRTSGLLDQYEAALQAKGIPCTRIRRSQAEDRSAPGVRLATMHRVKGLEFDGLIVAGVNEGKVPLATGDLQSEDGAVREEAEQRERALLYVAVTRARRRVLVTCHGAPSPFLAGVRG
jgi:superfamily I DNA/RNA helicase